jgi:hypothetical protein
MITDKINNLFKFIEFLHSNIDNFNLNNNLITELELLDNERQTVRNKKTFKDKLKFDELQEQIKDKFNLIQERVIFPIESKAKELNICNIENRAPYTFYGVETEIQELKNNFTDNDLTIIFTHKNKYIQYRTNTHKTFFSLGFFFDELDEVLKELFNYFKETEQNEFEAFERKTIQVDSIKEAVMLMTGNIKIDEKQEENSNVVEKEKLTFKFDNNFDSVEPQEIYKFFREKLVDKKHLTLENLEKYLILAFQEKTPPKPLMKFDNVTTKKKINTIFYTYYHDIAQKPHNRQTEYAELLGKYFHSYYTETIKSNWSKGYEIKR